VDNYNPETALNNAPLVGQVSQSSVTPISAEAQAINEFNKDYITLVHGGKNYVIRNNTDPFGHNYLEFFSQKEFIDSHRDKHKIQVIVEGGSGPTVKQINPARVWIESPESNSAKYGLTFYPEVKRFHNDKFNTYMGRGCDPVESQKKEISIYLKHIHKVICNNDDNAYKYVIQWLAHLVQKPHEKPEVAIVLKAGQGTGKGTFVDPIGKIIGSHYLHAQSPEQVIGKFNAQLENKLLVFADEFFAGSKSSTDRLKTMITERLNTIERKGQDRISVPCFARIIMATNHENVIKIERDERRYLYLEVSEEHKQDRPYFEKLHNLINLPDFPNKLLSYLLGLDISKFNPRNVPKTDDLTEQKIDNLEPLDKWLYTALSDGEVAGELWPARMKSSRLHEKATYWLDSNKLTVWGDIPKKVGKLMAKIGASTSRPRTGEGGRQEKWTEFKDLDESRQAFSEYINADLKW
jgi:putative DNA primase/helicase